MTYFAKWKNIFKHTFLAFIPLLWAATLNGQEFRAQVTVDASQIPTSNLSVFKTLEKDWQSLINKTRWTDRVFESNERIECSFLLSVRKYENNRIEAELSISSFRPVYNSTYKTPLLLLSDKKVVFNYQEYQPLTFTDYQYENNLVSITAFYLYMILGYDFDSFKNGAGKPYFEKAQKVAEMAAGAGASGWDLEAAGKFSRRRWVQEVLDENNTMFHTAFYNYHRRGLDFMADDPRKGKTGVAHTLQQLGKLDRTRSQLLLKLFFDAKSDEIVRIFSGGPRVPAQQHLPDVLMELAPYYQAKWNRIK